MPPPSKDLLHKILPCTTSHELDAAVLAFKNSFPAYFWGPRSSTVKQLYDLGTPAVLIKVLLESPLMTVTSGVMAWDILAGMSVDRDTNEDHVMVRAAQSGILDAAVKEIRYNPPRFNGAFMSAVTAIIGNACGSEHVADQCLAMNIQMDMLIIIREASHVRNVIGGNNTNKINWYLFAIRALAWLARFRPGRLKDHAPEVVDACKELLKYLHNPVNDIKMIGFTAAKTLIRIMGPYESSFVIQNYPSFIEFYCLYLEHAISHPNEHVSISGQIMDLAFMSLSDVNKSLLVRAVAPIVMALTHFALGDFDVVQYSLIFLSQVSCEARCRTELMEHKVEMEALEMLINGYVQYTNEHHAMMNVVLDALDPTRTAVRSVAKSTTTKAVKDGWVMISYEQTSTCDIARALGTGLKTAGIRTWIDFTNMNNVEEMSNGIDGATCVLVLFTRQYKESRNCRMECTYAVKQQKPIIFLSCDARYTSPDGWLGSILGQSRWLACWNVRELHNNMSILVRQIQDLVSSSSHEVSHPEIPNTTLRIEKQLLELKDQNAVLVANLGQVAR